MSVFKTCPECGFEFSSVLTPVLCPGCRKPWPKSIGEETTPMAKCADCRGYYFTYELKPTEFEDRMLWLCPGCRGA